MNIKITHILLILFLGRTLLIWIWVLRVVLDEQNLMVESSEFILGFLKV